MVANRKGIGILLPPPPTLQLQRGVSSLTKAAGAARGRSNPIGSHSPFGDECFPNSRPILNFYIFPSERCRMNEEEEGQQPLIDVMRHLRCAVVPLARVHLNPDKNNIGFRPDK